MRVGIFIISFYGKMFIISLLFLFFCDQFLYCSFIPCFHKLSHLRSLKTSVNISNLFFGKHSILPIFILYGIQKLKKQNAKLK